MEKKKNPKADLEKSRSIFFLIGLIVAMGAVFTAFNASTKTSDVDILAGSSEVFFEEDEVLQIQQDDKKEIIQPKQQQVIDIISIVDDSKETEDIAIFTPEDDGSDVIFEDFIVPDKEIEDEPDIPINFASKMPVFPGGEIGLMKFISDKTVYPPAARDQGIEGKVYVRFCVTKFGTVDRVSIARGADPLLDKEALRVVKLLPKWQPGENGGRKVSVWYFVPINFKLN